MAAGNVAEMQKLVVRLVGDSKLYVQTLREAQLQTAQFTQDAAGRFHDMEGKFVSAQAVIQARAGATLAKFMDYGNSLKTLGNLATQAGQKMKQLGSAMTMRLTAPIVGLGIAGAKTFGEYETSLSRMVGLAGVNADEIGKIDAAIREMAPLVAKGPGELADAMYFIQGAGIKGATAVETLKVSAMAATAGLGDTVTVADAVTSALNAYGPENLSAARATDILTAAVREGKMEASELAPVMGRLLPTASAMGIAFEDVAGVMAVMSRTGLDAAEASVSVGAVLSTLLKPSKEAAEALHEQGLSMKQLRDIAQGPGGIVEVMRLLSQTFAENDEKLAMIVPNVRAFRGVMNVLAQDASIVDNIMGGVANSVGATQHAFDAGANTVGRRWAKMTAELKVAFLDLGEAMLPIIKTITKAITDLANWFSSLTDASQEWIVKGLAIAAVLGPLLSVLAAVATAIGAVVTAVGTLMASAAGMAVILTIGSALTGLVGMAAPWVALAAAIAGVLYYRKDIEEFLANTIYKLGGGEGKMDKVEMFDAAAFKSQVLESHQKVAAAAASTMPPIEVPAIVPRPGAIAEFAKSMETQLRNLEISTIGRNSGWSEERVQREQDLAEMRAKLIAEGHDINSQELRRLGILNNQMEVLERQAKAAEKRKKEEEKAAQKLQQSQESMARRARSIIEGSLSPMEELRLKLDEIEDLFVAGALTGDQANAARDAMVREFAESQDVEKRTAGSAIVFGSAEADLDRAQRADQSTEKGVWQAVNRLDVVIDTEEQILARLKENAGGLQVITIP